MKGLSFAELTQLAKELNGKGAPLPDAPQIREAAAKRIAKLDAEGCCAAEVGTALRLLLKASHLAGEPAAAMSDRVLAWLLRADPRLMTSHAAEAVRRALKVLRGSGALRSRHTCLEALGSDHVGRLVDAWTTRCWPVEDLVFGFDGHSFTLPAAIIVNLALLSPDARQSAEKQLAVLLPRVSPVPGFAALAMLVEAMQRSKVDASQCPSRRKGDRVLIDGKVIATYVGVGAPGFLRFQRGKNTEQQVKASECGRVYGTTRNAGASWIGSDALSRSLGLSAPFHFEHIEGSILVVMPSNRSERFSEISIEGVGLSDVLPVASLDANGRPGQCRPRFGDCAPALLFSADVRRAQSYLESQPGRVAGVVIDCGDTAQYGAYLDNLGAFARLIKENGIPAGAFADRDGVQHARTLREAGFSAWEWDREDLRAARVDCDTKVFGLRNFCESMATAGAAQVDVRVVENRVLEALDGAHWRLVDQIRERGEDLPECLCEILSTWWTLYSETLPICGAPNDVITVLERLRSIREKLRELAESPVLAPAERDSVRNADEALVAAWKEIETEAPKHVALATMIADGAIKDPLVIDHAMNRQGLAQVADALRNGASVDLVVTYWRASPKTLGQLLRAATMSRATLILYRFESERFGRWTRAERADRSALRCSEARRAVAPAFPPARVEAAAPAPTTPAVHAPARAASDREEQPIEEYLQRYIEDRISRAVAHHHGGELVDATLVRFEEHTATAFLTDSYHANVVTSTRSRATIEQKHVSELTEGDLVLFYKGSDRDVLRDLADSRLHEGVRELSELWWKALVKLRTKQHMTTSEIRQKLAAAGCLRTPETIRGWLNGDRIKPGELDDIDTVASVTGDEELRSRARECKAAVQAVIAEHMRAGAELAGRARDAMARTLVGAASELGDSIVAVTVRSVSPRKLQIPRVDVNRLHEEWPWRE